MATPIPEFAGTEEDNVQLRIQRVDKVAEVHRARENVLLLAATNKFTKGAKRRYETQVSQEMESWIGLKGALMRMFDQKIPYYTVMQKIETRRWNEAKETFHKYAIDKLALMYNLDLSEQDKINLSCSDN